LSEGEVDDFLRGELLSRFDHDLADHAV
jgi:hypothetical protein